MTSEWFSPSSSLTFSQTGSALCCAVPLLSRLAQQTARVSNSRYYKIGKFTVETK